MPSDIGLLARIAVLEAVVRRLDEPVSRMSKRGRQKYREDIIGSAVSHPRPVGIDENTWAVEIKRSAELLIPT